MKKSRERRSITNALICYSRLGFSVGCETPFEAYKRIEGACVGNNELALDMWALHECFMILHLHSDGETVRAIQDIYLKPFSKRLTECVSRNEISRRVLRFAYENNLDERTVYRRLKSARDLWLKIRAYGKQ